MTVIMRARRAVLFAFVISAGALLVAQHSHAVMASVNDTGTFLLKQRATTGYRGSIRKSILAYEGSLDTHCRKVDLDLDSVDVRDRILAPIEVDDKGVALAGRWRESVPGTACNEKRTFNVQVDVTRQGLEFTPTFPGEAAGDPGLENDTLKNIETDIRDFAASGKRILPRHSGRYSPGWSSFNFIGQRHYDAVGRVMVCPRPVGRSISCQSPIIPTPAGQASP